MEEVFKEVSQIPKPNVSGNAQLEILSHSLVYKDNGHNVNGDGVVLKLKNISGNNIGKFVLNIVFYGSNGNMIDIVEFTDTDFGKDMSRTLRIWSSKAEKGAILSYQVKVINVIMTPIPIVKGNDSISILKHSLREDNEEYNRGMPKSYIDISIRNVTDKTIASAIFEATFFDCEGNALDIIRHKELQLKPDSSRAITIVSNKITTKPSKSYYVELVKATTADIEKVQLVDHKIKTIRPDKEEVRGVIKNISGSKTDAVLLATFQDSRNEVIGTKSILVRDIEPGNVKTFCFVYDIPNNEVINKYTFSITGIIEEIR